MKTAVAKPNLLFALSLVLVLAAALPVHAQSMSPMTPSAQSETMGAATGLGSSHRFASKDAATAHCPNDTVVWSTAPELTYHLSGSPEYGKNHGFYACKQEADDAGFHAVGN